jgi:hypothetical protein
MDDGKSFAHLHLPHFHPESVRVVTLSMMERTASSEEFTAGKEPLVSGGARPGKVGLGPIWPWAARLSPLRVRSVLG